MLMALAKEGSPFLPNPIEQVFQIHHGMVFRTAYRITGNAADAEDVLQTVFLRMLRPEAGEVRQPESYLRRAAINVSVDLLRTRRESRQTEGDLPSRQNIELREQLRQSIAQLPAADAELFLLRFIEGHSNEEIARMTGMNKILVAVRIHRIRRRLQDLHA